MPIIYYNNILYKQSTASIAKDSHYRTWIDRYMFLNLLMYSIRVFNGKLGHSNSNDNILGIKPLLKFSFKKNQIKLPEPRNWFPGTT